MRLNKFIAEAGFCSRRRADELINEGGRVTVNKHEAIIGMDVSLKMWSKLMEKSKT